MPRYRRPPVVEAIVELQHAEKLEVKQYEKLVKKLNGRYPEHELLHDFNVEIRTYEKSAHADIIGRKDHHRFRTSDMLDVTTVTPTHLTTSRLAPYQGWERLMANVESNMELFHASCGVRRFNRAGVRYINRIDVHADLGLSASDLFNISLTVGSGELLSPLNRFLRAEYRHAPSGVLFILQCGNVDPVLMNHTSYIVDIDLVLIEDLPLKRAESIGRLNELRDLKNGFFEEIMTDAARKLFDV